MTSRRTALKQLALIGSASLAGCATFGERRARVVVIGGGFGGATLARTLKLAAPHLQVSLVEAQRTYTACPFSNLVIGTDRPLAAQEFSFANISAAGVDVIHEAAAGVDATTRAVTLRSGVTLAYDKLVLAPGITLNYAALPGYSREASESAPHAWRAGQQTQRLRDQIRAMRPGGTVAMVVPDNPYRCPPGPYERAGLIAHYLKRANPTAKILILDSKDSFSKKTLFLNGWKENYGEMISWQGVSDGARVTEVDISNKRIYTDFDTVQYDVANIIPPQSAGSIAATAGATDASGWCPIEPATFSSTQLPDTYVLGDAAIANAMPKSAFAANAQAKYCAVQILRSLRELAPVTTTMANTCYSMVTPNYAISVAGVYRSDDKAWRPVAGAGGTSPEAADLSYRAREAGYAQAWFSAITQQVYG